MPQVQADKVREQAAKAWADLVESGRATPEQIVALVREQYGDRWGAAEIREALSSINLPTLYDAWQARKTPEEREQYAAESALRDARSAFWDVFWQLPEDADWKSTKGQPLVAMILSRDSRGTATAEQYEMAGAILQQYLRDFGGEAGTEKPAAGGGAGGGGAGAGTFRRSSGGGGGGGGGGGMPRGMDTWAGVRKRVSAALGRQLADFFLRGTALESGALRELQALMEAVGFRGSLEEFLELLRGVFKARVAPTGAPRGDWR